MRSLLPLVALLLSSITQAQPGPSSVLILTGDADAARGPTLLKEAQAKLSAAPYGLTFAPGFPQVVRSDAYPGLRPGFTILIAGFCAPDAAVGVLEELKKVFPGAYERKVTGVEPTSCPKRTATAAAPALPNFDDALDKGGAPACEYNWKGRVTSSECTDHDREGVDWLLDKNDVLIMAQTRACERERATKKLILSMCPGNGPEITDKISCEKSDTTCVHALGPGLIAVEHSYSEEGSTNVSLRVYDVVKQKRLTTEEWSNGCAIGFCEMGSVKDVDGDSIPEIVFGNSRDRPERPERILKWKNGRFRDVGPFLWKGQPDTPRPE
ncbi:hypothetical protein [Pyxidicoccus xibeiensis]|uniref:hypothetical protein n=1 Tax=Pyxidicoccus xibeiensis TaxID=2906759 RepID=UPI0020A76047|nr:hypothetical protein [Pyxidicoccus xibeiensis]MCP3138360.1 hypothetical protein [Pyxidicoccus xibeiensis]